MLGLTPDECVFVDDDPQLVAAAVELGYHGVVMCRDQQPDRTRPNTGPPLITSLHELVPITIGIR
jgi:FMN phosphatase YigB (HAD superfamily)